MPVLRSAFCIAALSAVSSLAWADNIVVNNSTFSALPAGGLTAVAGSSDANCPSLVFFNGVCANPVSAPTIQPQANPVAQQTTLAQFSALPSGGLTAVVGPSPAGEMSCPSLVFFNGVCANPVMVPAPQQLQSDVGAQIYTALISGTVGQDDPPNLLFDPADPAPEPSTFALILAGAVATWFAMRYRRSLGDSRA